MFPVRLETSDGALVYDGAILPFVTGFPKVVVWGERVFLLHEEPEPTDTPAGEAAARLGAPAVYRETFWTAVLPPSFPR